MNATRLLEDLTRLGIRLEAFGDRLRYHPRSAVTAVLADRMKAHKAELLAMLQAPDVQPTDIVAAGWTEQETPDGWRILERADMAGLEIIDLPDPCPNCGGLEVWQDMAGELYCVTCSPAPDTGERLRRLAALARARHPVHTEAV